MTTATLTREEVAAVPDIAAAVSLNYATVDDILAGHVLRSGDQLWLFRFGIERLHNGVDWVNAPTIEVIRRDGKVRHRLLGLWLGYRDRLTLGPAAPEGSEDTFTWIREHGATMHQLQTITTTYRDAIASTT